MTKIYIVMFIEIKVITDGTEQLTDLLANGRLSIITQI